ncbi:hypothetical protein PG995_007653 [Apiospora arundinis]
MGNWGIVTYHRKCERAAEPSRSSRPSYTLLNSGLDKAPSSTVSKDKGAPEPLGTLTNTKPKSVNVGPIDAQKRAGHSPSTLPSFDHGLNRIRRARAA